MFTGIVEEVGTLLGRVDQQDAAQLRIRARKALEGVALGDSIAVNGVCLTVVDVLSDAFTTDVMPETWRRTALGALRPGDPVNLERAATPSTRLGGHLVQGHVDGVGSVTAREAGDRFELMRFTVPPELARYLVQKGSVAVDGVSLTVVEAQAGAFTVGLIPTTLDATTLGRKRVGDPVNVEVDVVAKYVEKFVGAAR